MWSSEFSSARTLALGIDRKSHERTLYAPDRLTSDSLSGTSALVGDHAVWASSNNSLSQKPWSWENPTAVDPFIVT